MKHKILLLTIAFFSLCNSAFGQFLFEERVQANLIASKSPKSVFMVDFWATWCGPCIHLWKQLEIFQEHFSEDLYILSLTQEHKSDIVPFLQKHPSKLSVGIDKGGELQKQLGGRLIPFGAIYSASGKLLWKGNPSDLSFQQLNTIIKRAKGKAYADDFFAFDEDIENNNYLTDLANNQQLPKGDYKLIKHKSSYEGKEATIQRIGQQLAVSGRLSQLFAFLLKTSGRQIMYHDKDKEHYSLLINTSDAQIVQEQIFKNILNDFKLVSEKRMTFSEAFEITLKSNHLLWGSEELSWGEQSNQIFILDNGQLLADNCSVEMLLYKIASIKELPFVLQSPNPTPTKQHDWNIHYKFDDLMEASFEELGMELRKSETLIPTYSIEAK